MDSVDLTIRVSRAGDLELRPSRGMGENRGTESVAQVQIYKKRTTTNARMSHGIRLLDSIHRGRCNSGALSTVSNG